MLRVFKSLLLRASEPYTEGHKCTEQDARDLNSVHAHRVLLHAHRRAKNVQTQEDLDLWVASEEPRLLASRRLARGGSGSRTEGRWREQGVEKEISLGAEAELERQMQANQTIPTKAQRAELLERLRATPTIIEQARTRSANAGLRRRQVLASLLDMDEDWRGG